jgi:hypothetical protein
MPVDFIHNFNIGDLVELESGVRLFVASQYRDCDGTPLYALTIDLDSYYEHMKNCKIGFTTLNGTSLGHIEAGMKLVRRK